MQKRHLASRFAASLAVAALTFCGPAFASATGTTDSSTTPIALPDAVRDADYHDDGAPSDAKVELGRMLFFDKILSGNRNISCATCHHPRLGTSDSVALPIGEGALGLGRERAPGDDADTAVFGRVPRNSPALWNLGAREFERMFHDGRVETDPEGFYEGGFITPAKWKLPRGLDNVLAAQAMFPVTSHDEMAGHKGENEIADAISLNNAAAHQGAWERLSERLQAIPEYVELFRGAYPDEVRSAADISFVRAANAIAAFEGVAFRSDQSPFDRHLRGETPLDEGAARGMELFYGKARCSSCHAGAFQTDHDFHAIAMPQIGPGKGDGTDAAYWEATGQRAFVEDFGRGRVTARERDNYRFRTPSLRNVALTGPWGHAGAYSTLEAAVRHHLRPVDALHSYQPDPWLLPNVGVVLETTMSGSSLRHDAMRPQRLEGFLARDGWVQANDQLRERIAAANELEPVDLSAAEIANLLDFLEALTDPEALEAGRWEPERVPSGLTVKD